MDYRLHHNPGNSASRATLARAEKAGVAATVTAYPEEPPDAAGHARPPGSVRGILRQ